MVCVSDDKVIVTYSKGHHCGDNKTASAVIELTCAKTVGRPSPQVRVRGPRPGELGAGRAGPPQLLPTVSAWQLSVRAAERILGLSQ